MGGVLCVVMGRGDLVVVLCVVGAGLVGCGGDRDG